MSLPVYQELPCQLDDKGNGSVSFTPFVTYGTASVILSVTGAVLTGYGYISLGKNPLGPCALAQGFGPFNVQYGQPVNIAISGGPPNVSLQLALKGSIYVPGESAPAENLQFAKIAQQNSNVLVDKQNLAIAGTLTYGPFDVSQFSGLSLGLTADGAAEVSLNWLDVNGSDLGYNTWNIGHDADALGNFVIADAVANIGPQVVLNIIPNGAANLSRVYLVPVAVPVIANTSASLGAMIQDNQTVADGGSMSASASFTAGGPAVLSMVCEFSGKNWELQLYWIDGSGNTHLIVSHEGNTKDYQVGLTLPYAPVVAKFYNNSGDGTSQIVEVDLIKSPKGTGIGLPGPQGPAGSGGGGSLSYDYAALGTSVGLTSAAVSDIFTTASLAVGVWKLDIQCRINVNNNGVFVFPDPTASAATFTVLGMTAADVAFNGTVSIYDSVTCFINVTSAGTVKIRGVTNTGSATVVGGPFAIPHSTVNAYLSGYTAIKVA